MSHESVLVGLSGGVDSAVAAMLLLERKYRVTGVMMRVYDGPKSTSTGHACYDCGEEEDSESAANLAKMLGIPFYLFDCAKEYKRIVLDYFRQSYLSGLTPNPCVRCNHLMKFGVLPSLARAKGLSFTHFATGHYARISPSSPWGGPLLRRAVDKRKDQTYFLYRLTQQQLSAAIFPVGGMTKDAVRALAAQKGLPMHNQPDSQDFYPGDYTDLLHITDKKGNIVDTQGRILGTHDGHWYFTPGQRKGLGIAAPQALYVLRVDAAKNEVVVGAEDECLTAGCVLDDVYLAAPVEGQNLFARIRSSQALFPVSVTPQNKRRLAVTFLEPQRAVAPGQSLVLYQEDLVMGGGIIQ
ncbi:tRNA-specific 2-thiouridylase MnmA [Deltaproteobacteria bacterium]|nr:tRNA-specific 2-thiouridylase MnmA [Deltaproteobacteria bacterium]